MLVKQYLKEQWVSNQSSSCDHLKQIHPSYYSQLYNILYILDFDNINLRNLSGSAEVLTRCKQGIDQSDPITKQPKMMGNRLFANHQNQIKQIKLIKQNPNITFLRIPSISGYKFRMTDIHKNCQYTVFLLSHNDQGVA